MYITLYRLGIKCNTHKLFSVRPTVIIIIYFTRTKRTTRPAIQRRRRPFPVRTHRRMSPAGPSAHTIRTEIIIKNYRRAQLYQPHTWRFFFYRLGSLSECVLVGPGRNARTWTNIVTLRYALERYTDWRT